MNNPLPTGAWRWAAMAALACFLAAGAFVVMVQAMLTLWDPLGAWQRPRVFQASVVKVLHDDEGRITGEVLAQEGGQDRRLRFAKEEAATLEEDEDLWLLQHYRIGGNRPGHFRLTPLRVVVEYPEPWMALALWALLRLRRRQLQAAKAAEPRERKVWKDDFHQRSDRFSPTKNS